MVHIHMRNPVASIHFDTANVRQKIKIFDMGMLSVAKYFLKAGVLQAPACFRLCLGGPEGQRLGVHAIGQCVGSECMVQIVEPNVRQNVFRQDRF